MNHSTEWQVALSDQIVHKLVMVEAENKIKGAKVESKKEKKSILGLVKHLKMSLPLTMKLMKARNRYC